MEPMEQAGNAAGLFWQEIRASVKQPWRKQREISLERNEEKGLQHASGNLCLPPAFCSSCPHASVC